MGNGKKDDLKDPVKKCDKDLGALVADVMIFKSLFPKSKREPKDKVKAKIVGTTKVADKTTGANGRTPVVGSLEPGGYTVTLAFEKADEELYDVAGSVTSLTKDVKKCKTTSYPFEVPWFWIEHQVTYADLKTFVPEIEYVLRYQKPNPPNSPWAQRTTGTTGLKKVSIDKVPRGRYKLDLKLVYEPAWGDPHVEIDKPIELRAKVSGFDPGTAGTIQILDTHTLTTALYTLNVTVAELADKTREIKTTWTPTKAQLKDLKSARITFKAQVGNAFAFSEPESVYVKEQYDVVDDEGNKLTTQIELRFSGGHLQSKAVVGGQVEILAPWNEVITRVDMPNYKAQRIELDEGGITDRRFRMPA
jgi:hypothetical protein